MADKIFLKGTFAYREDTLENWQAENPILEKGEPSIVRDGTDGEWLKIGDGVTAWNDLPYKKGPRGETGPQGAQGQKGDKGDKGEKGDSADIVIDQTYSPTSENAQSGKAVAEAIKTEVGEIDKYGKYGLLNDNGQLKIESASPMDIDEKSIDKPLTPAVLNYAVFSVTDQTYDPNSDMPQSGKAVEEAVNKPWEVIEDITLTEAVFIIELPCEKIKAYNEAHIEAYILPTDKTVTSQQVQFNTGATVFKANVSCKATGKVYIIMDIYKSPRNTPIFDGTISAYNYTLSGASFKITKINENLSVATGEGLINTKKLYLMTTETNPMAEGTRIKVWGR